MGCAYSAVGMQRASDSAIGLPSSSSSASWMLAFLMPAEVRRSFNLSETAPRRATHRSRRSTGDVRATRYGATSSAITSNHT